MRPGWFVGSCLLLLLAALACDGGGGPAATDRAGVVGPAGGVAALGTEARVTVPAGALSREITIRIVPVPTPADLQAQGALGQAYRFEPVDQTFNVPARIAIVVPSSALGGRSMDRVTLLRSTAPSGSLVPAGEELDSIQRSSDGTVSGTATRFGVFSAAIPNATPTADAGGDQNVAVGTVVTLHGSGSDPDGDPLTFSWSFLSRPAGSTAALTPSDTAQPTFLADVAGTFEVRLTVSDGRGNAATDTVRIMVSAVSGNRAPVAGAGPDQNVSVGQSVTLDGSASSDPDGDALSFSWRFLLVSPAIPPITNADQARASFVPPTSGIYLAELTVSDGLLSDTDTVRVSVGISNRPPDLSVTVPEPVFPGTELSVVASASDLDGDPVTVGFVLVSRPAGSSAVLSVSGAVARLTPDVVGAYEIRVTASDGHVTVAETVFVYANPDVAGTYATTFRVNTVTGCPPDIVSIRPGDTLSADMDVTQITAGTIVLDLRSLNPVFQTNPVFQLRGEGAEFSGPIALASGGSSINVAGSFLGTITAAGLLSMNFSFGALGCRVTGTIIGSR